MDGARGAREKNLTFRETIRVQPCIRPLDAAVLVAGPDVIRGSVPIRSTRSFLAWHIAGFPIDGLDRFASTSSSPLAVHETRGRNLIFPSDSLFLRCRKPWPVMAAVGQQCPGDAGHLVRQRYGHHLERSPRQKLRQPRIFLRVWLAPPQHGNRPDHKNTPQVAVASLRDRSKLLFTPGRILARDEPNPGGKITPRPEGARIVDCGGDGARPNDAVRLARASMGRRASFSSAMFFNNCLSPSRPCAATIPSSAICARNALITWVCCRSRRPRARCCISRPCCSADFARTNRILGRPTASQIASASAASFLLRLTEAFTSFGGITRISGPGVVN